MPVEWTRYESYISSIGRVDRVDGEWQGRVNVVREGKEVVARINESFVSAEVAMKSVERVWEREHEQRHV